VMENSQMHSRILSTMHISLFSERGREREGCRRHLAVSEFTSAPAYVHYLQISVLYTSTGLNYARERMYMQFKKSLICMHYTNLIGDIYILYYSD